VRERAAREKERESVCERQRVTERARERKGETLEGVKRQEGADGGGAGVDALE